MTNKPEPNTRAGYGSILRLSAEKITQLEAQLAKLQADGDKLVGALEPFAECCGQIAKHESDEEWAKFRLLIGDYRRATQALTEWKDRV